MRALKTLIDSCLSSGMSGFLSKPSAILSPNSLPNSWRVPRQGSRAFSNRCLTASGLPGEFAFFALGPARTHLSNELDPADGKIGGCDTKTKDDDLRAAGTPHGARGPL